MPKMIKKSERVLNKIVNMQQLIANGLLIFTMLIISFDVLGRNFLNKPLKGTFEMTELTSALLVFFTLAITHRRGEHIAIDFIVEKFSKKMQYMLASFIEMVIFLILLLMARHMFAHGLRVMERGTTTTDLALAIYPFIFIITFTLIIFALVAIFKAYTFLRMAVTKNES